MTIHAFKTGEMILDERFALAFHGAVAGGAIHLLMLALQFEPRLIVVEPLDFPAFKIVAARTIRYTFLFKLRKMRILVAACTGGC